MTQTARVYGGSLYELAAEETLTDTIRAQMMAVQDLFRENPDYLALLCEPSIAKDERIGLIETAFGEQAERYLVSFLKLLCEKGILREYAGCCEEFTRRYNVDHNIAEAVATSAVALTDAQVSALKEKLEKQSGKTVVLTQKVDPSVMAGLRVEMEGTQLDGTVQGRILGISRKLADVVM
ncbi:MAG: ATP synthase F1 subunit delta [Lachnospiraceae bacterium]|nr:ATP synthase F1 subunit delta [Lachnospiraceae bacterium]